MPELPEVETVRRGLIPALLGQKIVKATIARADLRKPFPVDFADRLTGRTVEAIDRRAKYLLLSLDDGWIWLVHLGMSGRMLIGPVDETPAGRHDHVVVETAAGMRVSYNDPRRFGLMDLILKDGVFTHPLLSGLGPEPLDEGLSAKALAKALGVRGGPVKTVLLDQTVIAGLGNIYVCEALFRAGIHPARPANRLRPKEIARLMETIRDVLEEAIQAGGSSLKDHRQPNGELGYFQHSFKVYGREGEPCPDCDCASGIRRMIQAGRSTFYCEKRQR